jgi:hypothetical protein
VTDPEYGDLALEVFLVSWLAFMLFKRCMSWGGTSILCSRRLAGIGLSGLWVAAVAALAVSCASSRRIEGRRGLPKPPVFLSGPAAVLFTNVDEFGAHVLMETRFSPNHVEVVSGELLGRGNKLLFVPESAGSAGKYARAGGDTFIWDVTEGSGYVLNEALQGYAPTTSNVRHTNIVTRSITDHSGAENIAGHRCEQQEAIVESSDGSVAAFRVWRAAELKGFPVRINSTTNTSLSSISLSRIRLQRPANALFQPPDGFTKYGSVEAMMSELTARQQNVVHGAPRATGETERVSGREGGQYRGGR